MAQELTFEDWVTQGYKYKRFRYEFVICLKALDANMHKVFSKDVVAPVQQYTNVFHQQPFQQDIDETEMLEQLRLLRERINIVKETEENCLLVYQDVKSELDEKNFRTICVSRTKTALDLLSRYLRGIDKEYATQAKYIRYVYLAHYHNPKIGDSKKVSYSESDMLDKLMLVSPPEEARYSIRRALKNKRFRVENGITDVK